MLLAFERLLVYVQLVQKQNVIQENSQPGILMPSPVREWGAGTEIFLLYWVVFSRENKFCILLDFY